MYKSIRVCNVCEEGRFGGPAKRIIQVARGLIKHKVITHVVYPKLDSALFKEKLLENGIESTPLNITRLTKEKKILFFYVVRFLPEILILFLFFKKQRFDLVHVNGSYQLKAAIAAKLAGIAVIWHLNDTLTDKIVKKLFKIVSSACADGFIVAGKSVESYYFDKKIFKKKPIQEIHAPVDVEFFKPRLIPQKNKDELIIATVSGFNPIKGLEYFIKMASEISLQYPHVKFYIAGAVLSSQKKYTDYIVRLIDSSNLNETNLKIFGFVDDIFDFLLKADICVFTSIAEASPTAVWEAMSMGKPIVTTDVGSVSQYIQSGEHGFVVPIRDTLTICDKVSTLIEDNILRDRFGFKARELAMSKLDINLAVDRHVSIYRDILAGNF